VPTPFAFETDIGTQTGYFPLKGTAGVRLAQAKDIFQLQIGQHVVIVPELEIIPGVLETDLLKNKKAAAGYQWLHPVHFFIPLRLFLGFQELD
jgi:hypothetical protein